MNCRDCRWFLISQPLNALCPPHNGTCHLTPQSEGWPIVRVDDFCSHFTEVRHAQAPTDTTADHPEG